MRQYGHIGGDGDWDGASGPGIEDWDGDGNYFEKEHFESSVKKTKAR